MARVCDAMVVWEHVEGWVTLAVSDKTDTFDAHRVVPLPDFKARKAARMSMHTIDESSLDCARRSRAVRRIKRGRQAPPSQKQRFAQIKACFLLQRQAVNVKLDR